MRNRSITKLVAAVGAPALSLAALLAMSSDVLAGYCYGPWSPVVDTYYGYTFCGAPDVAGEGPHEGYAHLHSRYNYSAITEGTSNQIQAKTKCASSYTAVPGSPIISGWGNPTAEAHCPSNLYARRAQCRMRVSSSSCN